MAKKYVKKGYTPLQKEISRRLNEKGLEYNGLRAYLPGMTNSIVCQSKVHIGLLPRGSCKYGHKK